MSRFLHVGSVVAVVVIVVAAWWTVERTAEPAAAAGTPTDLERPRDEPSNEPIEVVATASARESVEAAPEARESPGGDRLVLRFVEAASGRPVPGARVWTLAYGRAEEIHTGLGTRPIATIRAHGEPHVADARGELRLPAPSQLLRVAATTERLRGSKYVSPPVDRPVEVALAPPRDLVVLVRTAEGDPIGGVLVGVGGEWREPGRASSPYQWTATDAGDGSASFEWGPLVRHPRWARFRRAFVEAALVTTDPVRVELDPSAPPAEPLVLELPALGRVVAELRDSDGVRLPGVHAVRLSAGRSRLYRWAREGRAVFERVPIGLSLVVDGSRGHGGSLWESFDGPARPGGEAFVSLRTSHEVATGRAVDGSGSPIADAELQARAPSRGGGAEVHTDERGGFAIEDPGDVAEIDEAGGRRAFELIEAPRPGVASRSAVVELPPAELEPHRLGDVVLRAGRTLVEGTIRDREGRPIQGALARLWRVEDESWRFTARSARADRDGRFVLAAAGEWFEEARAGELAVDAYAPSLAPAVPTVFAPGDELDLVLEREGAIVGRVEPATEEPLDELHLWFIPREWDGIRPPVTGRAVEPGAKFKRNVAPGRWDLTVAADGLSKLPLAVLRDVQVPAGGVLRDPRLDPWVVGGVRVELEVLGSDGRPVEAVELRAWSEEVGEDIERFEGNEVSTFLPDAAFELEVVVEGHAARWLRDVRGHRVVRLDPAPSVEITVRGDASRLAPENELLLKLVRRPRAPVETAFVTSYRALEDLPDEERFEDLGGAGRWEVRLFVRRDRQAAIRPFGRAREIEVAVGDDPGRFEILLGPGDVDDALRALEDD